MNRLLDKVAVVTGAGGGIGLGVARRFAAEGAKVVIAELNESTGKCAANEIESEFGTRVLFVKTDVSQKEDILAMVDATVHHFERVDILVNNAWGGGQLSRLEYKTTALMERALRVGFLGVFWAMQAVFPHMKASGWGRIITMCSLNGVNAHMYSGEYNSAKEASRTLTRTAAREWARHNITANVICPGAATAAFQAFQSMAPELAAEILKQNPMGRMGDPEEDIGPVAVFLASDESRYVTGNTIHADGGGHINGVAWAPELPD
jgi:NAD(P)-dependent dehydrogenase (short-subunit alcohol dehydrogenase family)